MGSYGGAQVELVDEGIAASPGRLGFTDGLGVDLGRCTGVSVAWKVPAVWNRGGETTHRRQRRGGARGGVGEGHLGASGSDGQTQRPRAVLKNWAARPEWHGRWGN